MKINRYNTSFDIIETDLNLKFWRDYYDGWENSTFDFLIKYFDKNKTFIDIGSWIGPISLVASYHSKQCICFEPDNIAYSEFQNNIKINNINNIILENKAVSIHENIFIGSDILGESITRDSCLNNIINCECINILEILNKYNLNKDNISVIKIDIEGHESELLKDKTLWNIIIPLHISLHPGWKLDKDKYLDDIIPFFKHKGVDTSSFKSYGNFFDITIE